MAARKTWLFESFEEPLAATALGSRFALAAFTSELLSLGEVAAAFALLFDTFDNLSPGEN